MSANNIVVAVYDAHTEAEQAVRELQRSGFDLKKMSIVAKNSHAAEHASRFNYTSESHRGTAGAHWGGVWDPLLGAASFSIPDLGPMLVAGPLVAWIIAAMENAIAVDGVTAMGAGFSGVGIPKNTIPEYEIALKTNRLLLIVNGTETEAAGARRLIKNTHPAELHTHPLHHAAEHGREPAVAVGGP